MNVKSISIATAGILFCLAACKKHELSLVDNTKAANASNLKIVHASAYNTNYTVQLKVNDTRVSNNITYSTPFPGGGLNTNGSSQPWYLSVNPGTVKIGLGLPRFLTATDSVTLYTGTVNLEANKYYSAYLFDTAASTQTVLVPENVAAQPLGTTRFKFVNGIPNVPALDLYVGSRLVASSVAYKGVSADFTLNTNDTARFYVRPAGAAGTSVYTSVYPALGNPVTAAFVVPNGRVMTVFSRGYSGASGTRAPAISLLYN